MTSGSTQEMDLDEFLGHSSRGPSANFLDGWKKRNPPQIHVVLHTKSPIIAVWQHPWPKIVTREKEGKEVTEVWSGSFNSWETEEVLKQQYRRDDTGMREHPPQICPMSIMLEEVHRLFREGHLSWDTELFRFTGDDPTKAKVLHTAPMLGLIKKVWEDLTDDEKKDAKRRGIPGPMDAWMESMVAKCMYVFSVVDYDNPRDGIQIARETTLVGDKMKKVIRDRITSEGEEKGHPWKHPYVFQWRHDSNAKQFQDKYDVVAIAKFPITDEIRALIVDKAAPDISRYVAKGNISDLRASMEDAYCGPEGLLDFDYIFAKAEALEGEGKTAAEDDDESAEDIASDIAESSEEEEPEQKPKGKAPAGKSKTEPKQEAKPAGKAAAKQDTKPKTEPKTEPKQEAKTATNGAPPKRTRKPAEDPRYVIVRREKDGEDERCYAADGAELFQCDECETIIRNDEEKCRKCGAEYEIETAPETEEEVEEEAEEESEEESEEEAEEEEAEEEDEEPPPPPPKKPAGKPASASGKPAMAAPGGKGAPAGGRPPAGGKAASAGATAKAAGKDRLGF